MNGIIGCIVAKVEAEVCAAGPRAGDEADPPLAGGSTSSPWGLDLKKIMQMKPLKMGDFLPVYFVFIGAVLQGIMLIHPALSLDLLAASF